MPGGTVVGTVETPITKPFWLKMATVPPNCGTVDFAVYQRLSGTRSKVAAELLHLPGKPAGVGKEEVVLGLAAGLLHLPGKPAGVVPEALPQNPWGSADFLINR
jgi:hypothetical protein